MRRGFLELAAIAALVAVGTLAHLGATGQDAGVINHEGFALSPGQCETGPLDCGLRGPKAWTGHEIEAVKKAIDEIVDRPGGRSVLARAQQRGAAVLYRFGVGLDRLSPQAGIVATLRRGRRPAAGIDLYDRFFALPGVRDAHSGKPGYLLVAHTLLHECMHAIDDHSETSEFLEVAGFVRAGSRWRFSASAAEAAALTRWDTELPRLEQAGDILELNRLNRKLALDLRPVRVPALTSIRGPAEAFADVGSHLILDDNARTYLPKALVAYFDANVFRR
jgi:hypothetical protein